VESIEPFDLVVFLGLFAMFIVGYAQGIVRRLLGIGAILFSLGLAAQLRNSVGGYLAEQWTSIIPAYGLMVGFGAVFVAAAVALSLAIQLSYRPAPLLIRYPVLDELLGGVLGILEGFLIFMAVLIIMDPYFFGAGKQLGGANEFAPFRSLHVFIDDALTARIVREGLIPGFMALFGWMFPRDVVEALTSALLTRG